MDSSIVTPNVSSSKSDDTIANIIIVVIVIAVLWYLFGYKLEFFSENEMENEMDSRSNSVTSPYGMMGSYASSNVNLKPELSSVKGYTDRNASVDSTGIGMNDSSTTNSQDNNPIFMTPDDRSLAAMNKISQKDSKGTGCNLLGINPNKLSSYKKKFYSMYKHQVECPKNCGLNQVGTRDCYMDKLGMKKCGMEPNDSACGGIFTYDYNNPDVFALGYLALDNNNDKPCVTCTFKPSGNNLNRSSIAENVSVFDDAPLPPYNPMEQINTPVKSTKSELFEGFNNIRNKSREDFRNIKENYADLPADTIAQDEKRLFQKNVSNANVSNYVDFENNTMLNSTGGETQVDKLAEIRTCTSGTCGLSSYGKSISDVYDKLLDTPAYTSRTSCNPNYITGVLEDASMSSDFANV
jgi:hypothetical protein